MPHKHVPPGRHALSRKRAKTHSRRFARQLLTVCVAMVGLVVLVGAANDVFVSSTASGTAEDLPGASPAAPAPKTTDDAAPGHPPVGAAAVGDASYPIPAHAVFVSPHGADSARGTLHAPFRTIGHAVAAAPAGDTIVLRAGSYHETVSIQGKRLTIQSYPHEAVWLDGSAPVGGWVAAGSRWVKTGWTHTFDHSPTYTSGAPDGTAPGWQWVSPTHPMAAHPDQFWVDGRPLRQVASLHRVTAGTFYIDAAGHRAYLGSNPAGHEVRASTIGQAMTVHAAGTTVRGIGIRRYAPSIPQLGAVTLESPSVTVDNVEISDMATTGVFAGADDITLRDVTVRHNGLLGIGVNEAYGIRLIGVNSSDNNAERFNTAPVSGGVKITRSRGILIQGSEFDNNIGPGIWLDESTYDSRIVGNRITGNTVHGLSLEISAKSLVADNLFLRNGDDGIKVNNTSNVKIWNNTVVGVGRSLDLVQDNRIPTRSYAHDNRRPFPDPTMTWQLGPVTVSNNVMQSTTADCLLCTEDNTHRRSAAALGIHADGDIYNRPDVRPGWAVVWSRGRGNPAVYETVNQFRAATGQEKDGRLYDGLSVVNSNGVLSTPVLAHTNSVARPLPSDVAAAVGHPSGSRQLGSFSN